MPTKKDIPDVFQVYLTNGIMIEASSCENKPTGHYLLEDCSVMKDDKIGQQYPVMYVNRQFVVWVGYNKELTEDEKIE